MNKPAQKKAVELDKPGAVVSPMAEPATGNTGVTEVDASVVLAIVAPRLSEHDAAALSDAELDAVLKTIRAEVRRRDIALEQSRPRAGSKVRIVKGRPKYVGKVGTALIVRRSRCFVSVPDVTSPTYALISDLELLER